MNSEERPDSGAGKWIVVVAVSALTAFIVSWMMSTRAPLAGGRSAGGRDASIVWANNWAIINDSVPGMGSAGVRATNRARYIARLQSLDLADDAVLLALRDRLISSARTAPPYEGGGLYDMVETEAIDADFVELRRQIRRKTMEQGGSAAAPSAARP